VLGLILLVLIAFGSGHLLGRTTASVDEDTIRRLLREIIDEDGTN